MKKYVSLIVVVFLTIAGAYAQSGVKFLELSHDFGEIKEEDGAVKYAFRLVNEGKDSLKIVHVDASCGCTTPGWTEDAIMPGDTGFVQAEYNPLNRPGKFEKTLKVSFVSGKGGHGSEVLHIEGSVKPKPRTVEDELPTLIGNVRLKFKSLNIGQITTEAPVVRSFDVYNSGDSVISWLIEKSIVPEHIKVSFEPEILASGEMGEIKLTYDPVKKNDLGFVSDNLVLVTDERVDSAKELHAIATILEYFPPMTEKEMAKAPRLVFNQTQFDFGDVNQGNSVVTTFTLTNAGKSDLIIRKIKPNCGCTVAGLKNNVIKPGDSEMMDVTFNSSDRKGRQYKTITVFSNDPSASSQMLTIKADVKD